MVFIKEVFVSGGREGNSLGATEKAEKINREFIHKYLIKQREEKWFSGTLAHWSERNEKRKEIPSLRHSYSISITLNGF